MKKIIIPVLSVVALAAIIGVIVFVNVKDRKFELPGRYDIEGEIKDHGYEVGVLDMQNYKSLGIDSKYTKIWAKYSDKEENECQNYDSEIDVRTLRKKANLKEM